MWLTEKKGRFQHESMIEDGPHDVPMHNPRSRIIRPETDGHIISSHPKVHNVASDWIFVVVD